MRPDEKEHDTAVETVTKKWAEREENLEKTHGQWGQGKPSDFTVF